MEHYFITGSSSGIGKAICEQLLERDNVRVVGISRSKTIEHPNYCHISLDLSKPEEIKKLEFNTLQEADKIVLLNNAGTLGDVKYLGDQDDDALIDGITLNLTAPAVLTQRFIRAYKDVAAEKVILNMGSGAAQSPYDGWSMYCATKAGLDMLTRVANLEQKIRKPEHPFIVRGVAPGIVGTDMQKHIRSLDKKDFSNLDKFIELYEQNALYGVNEVAEQFVILMDNASKVEDVIVRISLEE
ncbi:MAG: SDR family NAD(P)-dependent oxidoreductase [Chitinophagales bacterium]